MTVENSLLCAELEEDVLFQQTINHALDKDIVSICLQP
jgi:hypothetical protein